MHQKTQDVYKLIKQIHRSGQKNKQNGGSKQQLTI